MFVVKLDLGAPFDSAAFICLFVWVSWRLLLLRETSVNWFFDTFYWPNYLPRETLAVSE